MDIGAQVQQAMRDRRLLFMYQPIVTSDSPHRVVKYEALLRKSDGKGNIVPAGAFIPVIETARHGASARPACARHGG